MQTRLALPRLLLQAEHVVAVAAVVDVAGAVQEPLRQVGTTRHVLRLQRLPMSICQLNALFTANDSLLLLMSMPACLYLPQRRPTGCLLLLLPLLPSTGCSTLQFSSALNWFAVCAS